jgi:hypothetical protein
MSMSSAIPPDIRAHNKQKSEKWFEAKLHIHFFVVALDLIAVAS